MKKLVCHVLVLEDDRGTARMVLDQIVKFGESSDISFQCTHQGSLADALIALSRTQFDAVLSNVELPDCSGIKTIESIRETNEVIPLVALNEDDSAGTMLATFDAGADGYLYMGEINPFTLGRAILLAMEKQDVLGELRSSEATSAAVFDHTSDAIIIANEHQIIQSFNRTAELVFGYARDLLEDVDINATPLRRTESLRSVQRNGEHLLTIIDDMLDLCSVEAGTLDIHCSRCSPAVIVDEVASLTQHRAAAKGLYLHVDIDTELPDSIIADARCAPNPA